MSRGAKSIAPHLFRRLAAETGESAAVSLFLDLCRGSPELRHWLWEDFARDPAKRERLAVALRRDPRKCTRFADINGESDAWREETRLLRAKLPRRPYGGLTFAEVRELLVRHQAGTLDLAAFFFASEWRRLRKKTVSPILLRAAFDVCDLALHGGHGELLQHVRHAAELTTDLADPQRRRAVLGHPDWWKLNVLLHILRHPAPAYPARELQAHLAVIGIRVATRDIRRFCGQCGIRRDARAGRPSGARSRLRLHQAA
jgi:hypothetical protein